MNTVAEAHKRLDRIEPKIEQIDRDVTTDARIEVAATADALKALTLDALTA